MLLPFEDRKFISKASAESIFKFKFYVNGGVQKLRIVGSEGS